MGPNYAGWPDLRLSSKLWKEENVILVLTHGAQQGLLAAFGLHIGGHVRLAGG
jgi:hypothetical protein